MNAINGNPKLRLVERRLLQILASLTQSGLTLEISQDFTLFAARALEAERPLSPLFDPRYGMKPGQEGIWIAVRKDGILIHLQALRLDLAPAGLDHLVSETLLPVFFEAGDRPARTLLRDVSSAAYEQLSGRLVYQGALWTKAGKLGVSGSTTAMLTWYGQLIGVWLWDPDGVWALVARRKCEQGLPVRCGYTHLAPGAFLWNPAPEYDPAIEWLVWNSRKDVFARATLEATGSDLAEVHPDLDELAQQISIAPSGPLRL